MVTAYFSSPTVVLLKCPPPNPYNPCNYIDKDSNVTYLYSIIQTQPEQLLYIQTQKSKFITRQIKLDTK